MPEIKTQQINSVADSFQKGVFTVFGGFRKFCAIYGVLIVALSLFVLISNDLQYLSKGEITLNFGLFCFGFILALIPGFWGWAIFIAAIPLLSNLGNQLNAFLGLDILALPAPGFDLVGGFLFGSITLNFCKIHPWKCRKENTIYPAILFRRIIDCCECSMPWQVGFLLLFLTLEVALAISRNIYQSAAIASIKGVFFNLIHFRPIAWRSDFMPLADLVAYGMAATLIMIFLMRLRDNPCRSESLVRPLLFSLIISVLLSVVQSSTGIGLPINKQFFRLDSLGAASIGFHPDIHSFAGFILLGCVGLFGYFVTKKQTLEGRFLLFVISLSWLGLLLSKSRSSLFIAVVALGVYGLFKAHNSWQPRIFWTRLIVGIITVGFGASLFLSVFKPEYQQHTSEMMSRVFSKNIHFLSSATQEFGGRPEIFKAALYMFSAFPWLGIGQGEFYRQSSNEGFSHSFLLSAWGGENAHNYFLQTLAETGLIGIGIFLFVLLAPIFLTPKRSELKVGLIALGSLFLGNLYSHAFLVRENLLLGALFVGLLYSYIPQFGSSKEECAKNRLADVRILNAKCPISNSAVLFLIIMFACVIYFGVREVSRSFGKEPFSYGSECFINRPLTEDGWTSGLFMVRIPKDSLSTVLTVEPIRAGISIHNPLMYSAEIVNRKNQPIANIVGSWDGPNKSEIRIARPLDEADAAPREDSFILRLGNCYIPRDLGVSLDDRLLGVRILSISHH